MTSVDLTTQNGSAPAPGDFTAVTNTVTFAPGDTSATVKIKIKIKKDSLVAVEKAFNLLLSSPVFLTLGDSTGTATIKANHTAPHRVGGPLS